MMKKSIFGALVVFLFIVVLFLTSPLFVPAQSLPTVSGSSNTWGTELNVFLNVSLDANGTIRNNTINTQQINDSVVTAAKINASAVNSTHILDGTITTTDLTGDLGLGWGNLSSYPTGCTNQFVTTVGDILTCASVAAADLTSSSVNTTHILDGTIQNTDISTSAAIADNRIVDALTINGGTVTWSDLTSYPGACPTGSFLTAIGDAITCTGGIRNGTVSGVNQMITDNGAMGGSYVLGLDNSGTENGGTTHDILTLRMSGQNDGNVTGVDTYINFVTSGGEIGDISGTVTPGTVAYNTFTGSHWSSSQELKLEEGEILVSTGQLLKDSSKLPKVMRTNITKDPRVYGVYGGSKGKKGINTDVIFGEYGEEIIQVLSLGTGVIRVTDTNGNINNGDLITTSIRAGYGQKQDDDLFYSYTVAKATQSINWDDITIDLEKGFKWKLIAVTYHSG